MTTQEKIIKDVSQFFNKNGEIQPHILAFDEKKLGIMFIEKMPQTHQEKVITMLKTGFLLAEQKELEKLDEVYFVSEAWASFVKKGKEKPYIPPSEAPNRKEQIIIVGKNLVKNSSVMIMIGINRKNKKATLEKPKIMKSGKTQAFESPLLDAFIYAYQKANKIFSTFSKETIEKMLNGKKEKSLSESISWEKEKRLPN